MTWNSLQKGDKIYRLDYNLREERLELSTVLVDQVIVISCSSTRNTSHHTFSLSDGIKLGVYLSQEEFSEYISVGKTNERSTNYGTNIAKVLGSIDCNVKLYSNTINSLEIKCYKLLNQIDKFKSILENHEEERLSSVSIYSIFPDGIIRSACLEPGDWASASRFEKLDNYSYRNKSDGNIYYTTEWEAELHYLNRTLNDNLARIEELESDKKHKIKVIKKLNNLRKEYGLQ